MTHCILLLTSNYRIEHQRGQIWGVFQEEVSCLRLESPASAFGKRNSLGFELCAGFAYLVASALRLQAILLWFGIKFLLINKFGCSICMLPPVKTQEAAIIKLSIVHA